MAIHQQLLVLLDLKGGRVAVGCADLEIFKMTGGNPEGDYGGIPPDNEVLSPLLKLPGLILGQFPEALFQQHCAEILNHMVAAGTFGNEIYEIFRGSFKHILFFLSEVITNSHYTNRLCFRQCGLFSCSRVFDGCGSLQANGGGEGDGLSEIRRT